MFHTYETPGDAVLWKSTDSGAHPDVRLGVILTVIAIEVKDSSMTTTNAAIFE